MGDLDTNRQAILPSFGWLYHLYLEDISVIFEIVQNTIFLMISERRSLTNCSQHTASCDQSRCTSNHVGSLLFLEMFFSVLSSRNGRLKRSSKYQLLHVEFFFLIILCFAYFEVISCILPSHCDRPGKSLNMWHSPTSLKLSPPALDPEMEAEYRRTEGQFQAGFISFWISLTAFFWMVARPPTTATPRHPPPGQGAFLESDFP